MFCKFYLLNLICTNLAIPLVESCHEEGLRDSASTAPLALGAFKRSIVSYLVLFMPSRRPIAESDKERVHHAKSLSLTIDAQLSWTKHVDEI